LNTGPIIEPVALSEAKLHCRIDSDDDDVYLVSLIRLARRHIEDTCNIALIEQTWDWYLDTFPLPSIYSDTKYHAWSWQGYSEGVLYLPLNPLISVTHIKYVDTDGVNQTWDAANYTVDTTARVARIYPAYNVTWPTSVRDYPKAINIQFVAGYADSAQSPREYADNVPQELKHAILLLVGHLYKHRELTETQSLSDVPWTVDQLITPYRNWSF
jgi:uncharacterized phiE125 gp8 family phage protein